MARSITTGVDGARSVPHSLTSLIARDEECATVGALLRDPDVRLLTVTGPGGVGKTRLALAVADAAGTDFPDGVVFINLAPIRDPHLVMDTIATTLGRRGIGAGSLQERLIGTLADRQMLLVLDNFEQVITAGPQVHRLLGPCPGVTLLVTSRTALRLSGEREFPVAPLPVALPATLRDATRSGAIQLFVERAQAINPEFSLTAETLPVVAAIVKRVDGIPLAIELAAARMKALTPDVLLQHLGKRLPLLSGGPRDLPLRQQTMRDTIDWSYELLDAASQDLFRRLAVFAGGFTLSAAEAVCFGMADDPAASRSSIPLGVLDEITTLVDHSLLRQIAPFGDEPRYIMLETVREYARERLEASSESAIIHKRHAVFFMVLAETPDGMPPTWRELPAAEHSFWAMRQKLTGPNLIAWLNRLEADHDNLRAALDWLAHGGEPEAFLRLARSLSIFWLFHGSLKEGRTWLERALAQEGETPPLLRSGALFGLGLLAVKQSDVAQAESCFGESLAMSQQHGFSAGIAYGWSGLGLVAMHQLQFAQATQRLGAALAGARQLDDPLLASACAGLSLSYLGASAYGQGALQLAASHFEAAILELRAVDSRRGIGFCLVGLGYAVRDQGDIARAVRLFAEGLAVLTEVGDRSYIALALDGLAGLALAVKQPERAARLFGAAASLRDASGLQVEPAYRVPHERDVAAVRTSLGVDAFAACWAAGAALPLSMAIAEATNGTWSAPDQVERLGLTPRETEVLKLLAGGLSDREIADALHLSPRTVGWHVNHLLTKLEVSSRTAAATAAVLCGLV